MRYVPVLIIIGLLAAVLIGWAYAYWRARRDDEREDKQNERESDS